MVKKNNENNTLCSYLKCLSQCYMHTARGKLETSQVLAASKNFVTSFEHLKYVYPIDFIKLHFH